MSLWAIVRPVFTPHNPPFQLLMPCLQHSCRLVLDYLWFNGWFKYLNILSKASLTTSISLQGCFCMSSITRFNFIAYFLTANEPYHHHKVYVAHCNAQYIWNLGCQELIQCQAFSLPYPWHIIWFVVHLLP